MAAGKLDVRLIETLTQQTVSGAMTEIIAGTDATARFTLMPINVGKGAVIVGVSQA